MGTILMLAALVFVAAGIYAVYTSRVRIGSDEIGLVKKKTALPWFNRQHPVDHQIALNGEAGWQPDTLRPGDHWRYWRWMYDIQKIPVVRIPPGEIGLVVANDGEPLPPERQLGRVVECHDFQDARAFLTNGGQMGRQLGILTAGTYRINTKLFTIITAENAAEIDHDLQQDDLCVYTLAMGRVGIVITLEGAPLPADTIAGPVVLGHNNFQNGQRFIDNGGCKGIQEEVLQAGSYHLNPWFVRVAEWELTRIAPGTVGVVISHVGKALPNHTSTNLVERGYKGVWKTPLPPGQYPVNVAVMEVVIVPTYEITLDWSKKEKGEERSSPYDASLGVIRLRSTDGYEFDIQVTQIIRISGEDAPKMVLRIGSPVDRAIEEFRNQLATAQKREKTRDSSAAERKNVTNADDSSSIDEVEDIYPSIQYLVTRVMEPIVGNHFRNSAQEYGALDFLANRRERQNDATQQIKSALEKYGVQAVGTFINEIGLPADLEKTLQARKFAEEERKTLEALRLTEEERGYLAEKQVLTARQEQLVKAQTEADMAPLQAAKKRYESEAEADAIRLKAQAEADAIRLKAQAEADVLNTRQLNEVDALQKIVGILGHEGYLRSEQIKQLVNLKLPDTIFGSTGLLETLIAQVIGNRGGQSPELAQSNTTKIADRLIEFLKEHPTELQVILKSLSDQTQVTNVSEIDATPSALNSSRETSVDVTATRRQKSSGGSGTKDEGGKDKVEREV